MFELPPLPFAENALQPHMSAETLRFHHGKHHKSYVDKLNGLVAGTEHEGVELEELILAVHSQDDSTAKKIFNNAAQHWNHSFFWNCLAPGGGRPSGKLAEWIDRDLGGFEAFAKEFAERGANHFASGWAWLVFDNDHLDIMDTHDADLPLAHGKIALLTCDVWEHAYYIDYRNERPKFLQAFLGNLANWDFAAQRLEAATLEPVEG